MWSLCFINSKRTIHLLTGKEYTIGRKDADIVISDDSSVSRKHGTICIEANKENKSFVVTIKDFSKFGIYYARNADDSLSGHPFAQINTSSELKDGDIVRIGMQHTLLKLKKQKMIVIASMMDNTSLSKLEAVVSNLGGILVNSWQPDTDVTHLVINEIILNVKVTQALANSCHIVTSLFFNEYHCAVAENKSLPLPENFLPPISENSLDKKECSFFPNLQRKSLFNERLFIFLDKKQFKRLGLSCSSAGGVIKLICDLNFNDLEALISRNGTAVISLGTSANFQLITEKRLLWLQETLTQKKQRFIQEHEIGLSLLYCCCDVYTNPEFDLTSENTFTQRTIPGASLSQAVVNGSDSAPSEEMKEDSAVSLQPDTMFTSRVPETVGINTLGSENNNVLELSSFKKRSHKEIESPLLTTEKTPAKLRKLNENITDEIMDEFLDDFTSTRSKQHQAKPAPKRRTNSQKKESLTKVKSDLGIITTTQNVVDEKNEFMTLPDSCIDDDSLWSSKTDDNVNMIIKQEEASQVDYERRAEFATENKVPKRKEINENAVDTKDTISVDQTSSLSTGSHISNLQTVPNSSSSLQVNQPVDTSSLPEICAEHETGLDPNKPFRDLANIVQKSLVIRRSDHNHDSCSISNNLGRNIKNFKRFQKIFPVYSSNGSQTSVHSLETPRIIGGRDLEVHVNQIDCNAISNDWGNVQFHANESQEPNPFDNLLNSRVI